MRRGRAVAATALASAVVAVVCAVARARALPGIVQQEQVFGEPGGYSGTSRHCVDAAARRERSQAPGRGWGGGSLR